MGKKKLLKFIPLSLLTMMMLTGCEISGLDGDSFVKKLIPDWLSFVVQLTATIVMVIVVIIFAYKPVKKIIKKRQDYVENNIREAEVSKARANENVTKSEELLLASQKKANEIIEDAKATANVEKDKILTATNVEVEKMKQEAQQDIIKSKEDAKEEIRKEMVSIALDASSEILSRSVNDKDNAKLAEDFIRSVNN